MMTRKDYETANKIMINAVGWLAWWTAIIFWLAVPAPTGEDMSFGMILLYILCLWLNTKFKD